LSISLGVEVIPCRPERQGYKINFDGRIDKKPKDMLKSLK